MTAPRWFIQATEAALLDYNPTDVPGVVPGVDELAAQLIEHLPIEAMTLEIRSRIAGVAGLTGDWVGVVAGLAVLGAVRALTGDHEVITLTELHHDACRALDAAGVPYAEEYDDNGETLAMPFNLAGRIRWLAKQRPTALELKRVTAERDAAERELAELRAKIRADETGDLVTAW